MKLTYDWKLYFFRFFYLFIGVYTHLLRKTEFVCLLLASNKIVVGVFSFSRHEK